jgi:hypothetical protein
MEQNLRLNAQVDSTYTSKLDCCILKAVMEGAPAIKKGLCGCVREDSLIASGNGLASPCPLEHLPYTARSSLMIEIFYSKYSLWGCLSIDWDLIAHHYFFSRDTLLTRAFQGMSW